MQDGKTALMKAIAPFVRGLQRTFNEKAVFWSGISEDEKAVYWSDRRKIIRLLLDKECDMNVQDNVCS